MDAHAEAKAKAATAYNSAADYYDDPANSFWERYGRRTVERLNLAPGARVLDACCGSGASAIPAAEIVGPNGFVLGVDLANNLLELARKKAANAGLGNVEFQVRDILNLDLPPSSFDAVICVFGIFFAPDMELAVRELWRLVRPKGKLAITTWGPNFFEPASSAFWHSIRSVRPDLYKGFNPWDRISEPNAVRSLLESAETQNIQVVAEADLQPVNTPADWWTMVLGSGYRGTVEQLTVDEQDRVRRDNIDFIRGNDVRGIESNVVYATAVRSA